MRSRIGEPSCRPVTWPFTRGPSERVGSRRSWTATSQFSPNMRPMLSAMAHAARTRVSSRLDATAASFRVWVSGSPRPQRDRVDLDQDAAQGAGDRCPGRVWRGEVLLVYGVELVEQPQVCNIASGLDYV